MNEQLVSFEVAKLLKEKGFTFNDIIDIERVNMSRNGLMYRDEYEVFYFDYWQYTPKDDYAHIKESIDLKRDSSNSTGIDLLVEEYSTGNQYGYKAYLAPTQSLAQKWLREVHNIHIQIERDEDDWKYELYNKFKYGNKHIPNGFNNYPTYEEALEEGLKQALILIKDELNNN